VPELTEMTVGIDCLKITQFRILFMQLVIKQNTQLKKRYEVDLYKDFITQKQLLSLSKQPIKS
jgi:hypothetical protein